MLHMLRELLPSAGVTQNRAGSSIGTYKTAESIPAQKRVKKRKGPDGSGLDSVSAFAQAHCCHA